MSGKKRKTIFFEDYDSEDFSEDSISWDKEESDDKNPFRVNSYYEKSTPSSSATVDYSSVTDILYDIDKSGIYKELYDFVSDLKKKKPKTNIERTVDFLSKQYQNGDLVLVLGSGISRNRGLPNWDKLLLELMARAIKSEGEKSLDKARIYADVYLKLFSRNPLITARYIRQNSTEEKVTLESKIQSILYKSVNLESSDLYTEIIEFCNSHLQQPTLDSIITYNYDDLIEYFCKNRYPSISVRSIYSKKSQSNGTGVPIYHVHGYLPNGTKVSSENKIVLSEESYHEQYSDIYNWSNLVQIEKFMHKTCIFIGLSFNDPNLRRLLGIAHDQISGGQTHYIINKREGEKLGKRIEKFVKGNPRIQRNKGQKGIKLNEFRDNLIEMIYSFEEIDLKTFGIKAIWVDEWDEIPKILNKIRNNQE